MSEVTVEVVGGPLDGQFKAMEDSTPIIEVHMDPDVRHVERHVDGAVKVPKGRYRASLLTLPGGPTPYVWQGEV